MSASPVPSPAEPIDSAPTVLVTGAGGPAGVAVIDSLRRAGLRVVAADMSPHSSGLFQVPEGDRATVPPGAAPGFVDAVLALATRVGARLVVPTVDVELEPLAAARDRFDHAGVGLVLAEAGPLAITLDKLRLAARCASAVRTPRTESYEETDAASWTYPVIVKPRRGSGSRGVRLVRSAAELMALQGESVDEPLIVQEHLPGEEYSVDVLADRDGRVLAAVPRSRLRIDSGVAVVGSTLVDAELAAVASAVVERLGLGFVSNVQLRRDADGRAALLEVNPRFPGSMPLTVASGVDMPRLVVEIAVGRVPVGPFEHTELVDLRYLSDVFVSPSELARLMDSAPGGATLVLP